MVVEDSPDYAELIATMLVAGLGADVQVDRFGSGAQARAALIDTDYDCALLDLSLPDARRLEVLELIQAADPSLPVVVLTGNDDEDLALQALHAGAQDFVCKRRADSELLGRSLRYAVERKHAELRLAHQALHDALTGLPNRTLLMDRLAVALARARRHSGALALLFLDLDRFKTVNDSLGHEAGDELLVTVAGRLSSIVRPSDTVARFGGDEFLVLCEEVGGEQEPVHLAERARAAISQPMNLRGREILVHASVGIACSEPMISGEELIRQADAAMYRAKQAGGGIELFAEEMHAEAVAALEAEHQLRRALERGELRLHFQPVLAVRERPFVAALEGLLRWEHPERGLLLPGEMIPTAEQTGLIVPIGEWVLREACNQLAAWRRSRAVHPNLVVSVNLSLVQLGTPGFADLVAEVLTESGLPPRCLYLEVTESTAAREDGIAANQLNEIKKLGVGLALDDFGTGYSSLSALQSYPIDMVKIDRSFLSGTGDGGASERMFKAVLEIARAAGLHTLAEGVESQQQLELLRSAGCENAQGFHLSRPLPPERVVPWITGGAWAEHSR